MPRAIIHIAALAVLASVFSANASADPIPYRVFVRDEFSQITMRWSPSSNLTAYSVNDDPFGLIPAVDDDTGAAITPITVDGNAGDETLSLDFRNGAISRPPTSPPIEFFAPAVSNNTIELLLRPGLDQVVQQTSSSIVVRDLTNDFDTSVFFDAGVSQIIVEQTPEPTSLSLTVAGAVAMVAARRRRSHSRAPDETVAILS